MMRSVVFLLGFAAADLNVSSSSGGTGTIYVVRHGETSGHKSPYGISPKGLRRADYLACVFCDGCKFKAPATVFAGYVDGKLQRMVDTVRPAAENQNLKVDQSIGPLTDSHWTDKPDKDVAKAAKAALSKGPVLIGWWSYIEYLCKALGHKCPHGMSDFSGNDEVLVVEMHNGDVKSMTLSTEGYHPSPSPTPCPSDTRRRRSAPPPEPSPTPTPPPMPTPTPIPTPSPSAGDTLTLGDQLHGGDHLVSSDGNVRLEMQTDGNLVIYHGSKTAGKAVWASGSSGNSGSRLAFQTDGNLVMYDQNGSAGWNSGRHSGATKAIIQSDCDFVTTDDSGSVLWSLGTQCNSETIV